MSIYKYSRLAIDRLTSFLENGIYISKLTDLNDPYEYYQIHDSDNYRICALTTSCNAKLMWSHYADGHKGISILLDIPDELRRANLIRPVQYDSLRTTDFSSSNKVVEALYHKDKKWFNEKENRVVMDIRNYNDKFIKKIDENYYLNVKVKAVYFGASSHLQSNYLDCLLLLRDYNEKNPKNKIKVEKFKPKREKFQFVKDKEFKYLKEIELLQER